MNELLESGAWQGRIWNGSWVEGHGGTTDSTEPATGASLGTVGLADASDVATAAITASAAQPEWAATPGPVRAALIRKAAMVLEANRAEFERWLVREGGAVPGKAA